jgi:hypothetical protein
VFSNTLNATTARTETLDLTAGTGDITFNATVGGTRELGAVIVASAKDLTIVGTTQFFATSFTQTSGSGTTALGDTLITVGNTGTVDITNNNITGTIRNTTADAPGTIKLTGTINVLLDIGTSDLLSIEDFGVVTITGTATFTTGSNILGESGQIAAAAIKVISGSCTLNGSTCTNDPTFFKTLVEGIDKATATLIIIPVVVPVEQVLTIDDIIDLDIDFDDSTTTFGSSSTRGAGTSGGTSGTSGEKSGTDSGETSGTDSGESDASDKDDKKDKEDKGTGTESSTTTKQN